MISVEKMNEIEETIKTDSRFINLFNEMKIFKGKETGHTFASRFEDLIAESRRTSSLNGFLIKH